MIHISSHHPNNPIWLSHSDCSVFYLTPNWWRFGVSFWPHRNLKMTCEEKRSKELKLTRILWPYFLIKPIVFLIINHGKDPPILQQILGLQQINHGKFFPLIKAYKPESSHRCIHSSRPPTSRLADNNMYVHISQLGALFSALGYSVVLVAF